MEVAALEHLSKLYTNLISIFKDRSIYLWGLPFLTAYTHSADKFFLQSLQNSIMIII